MDCYRKTAFLQLRNISVRASLYVRYIFRTLYFQNICFALFFKIIAYFHLIHRTYAIFQTLYFQNSCIILPSQFFWIRGQGRDIALGCGSELLSLKRCFQNTNNNNNNNNKSDCDVEQQEVGKCVQSNYMELEKRVKKQQTEKALL